MLKPIPDRKAAMAAPIVDRPPVHEQQNKIAAAFAPRRAYGFAYLLLFRFALVNVIGLALVGFAWLQGWMGLIMAGDPTYQCAGIAAVFLAGLFLCAQRVWRISREINEVDAPRPHPRSKVAQYLALIAPRPNGHDGGESRSVAAAVLRAKLVARNSVVRHIANTLVILGLLGTVIGFIMALSGVSPEAASDIKAVGPMISKLISGMSVALYTTLVGAILNVWLMANYHLLATGTVNLVAAIVERGERDGHG
jgi:hypothetical protein